MQSWHEFIIDLKVYVRGKKFAFFTISIDSLYLQELGAERKRIEKKIQTPKKLKNHENFWLETQKTPLDFDSLFFEFSHL